MGLLFDPRGATLGKADVFPGGASLARPIALRVLALISARCQTWMVLLREAEINADHPA
ncbi:MULTISPECIES: hypothetical protein [Rhodomicrobium]|uniref:hypothetical protein n=1 Tax=Rhodomicrobium TaxID=1068 RepID=UPI0014825FE4|nr:MULTISPECIES: hypothetical protein [Rhodomicrobium]